MVVQLGRILIAGHALEADIWRFEVMALNGRRAHRHSWGRNPSRRLALAVFEWMVSHTRLCLCPPSVRGSATGSPPNANCMAVSPVDRVRPRKVRFMTRSARSRRATYHPKRSFSHKVERASTRRRRFQYGRTAIIHRFKLMRQHLRCKFLHDRCRMLTGEQLRAARAMLKMEQGELAELSGVSVETIKRLERIDGPISANSMTLDGIQKALEGEGAMFLPENGGLPGVRLRREPPANIRTRKRRGDPLSPASSSYPRTGEGLASVSGIGRRCSNEQLSGYCDNDASSWPMIARAPVCLYGSTQRDAAKLGVQSWIAAEPTGPRVAA